jgi:hypothetical protein
MSVRPSTICVLNAPSAAARTCLRRHGRRNEDTDNEESEMELPADGSWQRNPLQAHEDRGLTVWSESLAGDFEYTGSMAEL